MICTVIYFTTPWHDAHLVYNCLELRELCYPCSIYLVILSYSMEPMGYGLKMRKKATKEKQ
jgi:hypothetical protein